MKKIQKESLLLFLTLSFFLHNQFKSLFSGGTTWDDQKLIETSQRIIEKASLFFKEPSNPFISEFDFNLEFYGYLVGIPVYVLTKNEFVQSLLSEVLLLYGYTPLNVFDQENIIRFITLNIYIVIAIVVAYKLLLNFYSRYNALLVILFLIMIPSFSGHALFNIKDIPFALQLFITSLYLLKTSLLETEESSTKLFQNFFSILLISSVLLIRFNGILFVGMFSFYLFIICKKKKSFLIENLVIYSISIILFFLGSPSSWQKPVLYLKETIKTQFFLVWPGSTLTNGEFIIASEMDPTYLLTWFFYKLPIVYHIALIFLFLSTIVFRKTSPLFRYSTYYIVSVNLAFIFFLPITYDGIRQYIFLLPFYSILLVEALLKIKDTKYRNVLVIFIITYSFYTQAGLGPFKYTYFNEFSDEDNISRDCTQIDGCGDWPTDYWGYSGKQLSKQILLEQYPSIFTCEPTNVFLPYLDDRIEALDVKQIKKGEDFYLINIRRPMLNFDTCGFYNNNFNYECEVIEKVTTRLRNTELDLSYLQKCKLG